MLLEKWVLRGREMTANVERLTIHKVARVTSHQAMMLLC